MANQYHASHLAEARVLIDKQDKDQIKQDRLRQLEEEFEQHRAKKQKEIEKKLIISEQNKNKNLQTVQKKLSQVASRHQSVHTKALSEKQSELDRQFDSRKIYAEEVNRTASRISNKSDRPLASRPRHPIP